MSNIREVSFYRLARGKEIYAQGVNENFAVLYQLIGEVARMVRTPEPVVTQLEKHVIELADRLDSVENLSALHARQRNEKEFAPLSSVGALLVRMNQLQEHFDAAVKTLEHLTGELLVTRDGQEARIKKLEQHPHPTMAQHEELLAQVTKAVEYARLALQASTELRRTTNALTKALASPAPERALNQPQYASMAYIGHILQRLKALEDKVP